MKKAEAMAFTRLTTRQFERRVSAGEIRSRKVPTKTGRVAEYNDEDLQRIKDELEGESANNQQSPEDATAAIAVAIPAKIETGQGNQTAITTFRHGQSDIVPATSRQEVLPEPAKVFAASHRIVLSIEDICLLTPFSRDFVRAAFVTGDLRGRKVGRGWCANREEVDRWRQGLLG